MDKYDLRTGCLASTGANPCVIFLVLFMNNEEIFIEHRFSIPDNVNKDNMKKCLSYVASHIDDLVQAKTNISLIVLIVFI
ncbi:unnamed protein product [Rotaria sordida]|uniref:Uncharacterized protein n=1 Tax=Rotaria sordida TaxID=392033 RepID=A0A818QGG0_9BILA|nr:unnamed protein product [Rotaria sordida]CAF1200231.1 unnamed protein product [Rotaria sordida]CAF3608895.1 unnamed protein product [Rotaria sordida]CAF3639694.1 unnamed protein product [Rotaria sordida]